MGEAEGMAATLNSRCDPVPGFADDFISAVYCRSPSQDGVEMNSESRQAYGIHTCRDRRLELEFQGELYEPRIIELRRDLTKSV